MKNIATITAFAVLIMLSSCKTTQVTTGGSSGSSGSSAGGKAQDNSAQAVFARELPAYRISPEETNELESFEHVKREDPRLQTKPAGPVESSKAIDTSLEYKLSKIREERTKIDQVMGYRILLYSGTDVSYANELVKSIERAFQNYDAVTEEGSLVRIDDEINLTDVAPTQIHFDYVAPNYIVKIGNYISRIDAHHVFIKLKEAFPNAIVTSEPVDLKLAE